MTTNGGTATDVYPNLTAPAVIPTTASPPSPKVIAVQAWTETIRNRTTAALEDCITRLTNLKAAVIAECQSTDERMQALVTHCEGVLDTLKDAHEVADKVEAALSPADTSAEV